MPRYDYKCNACRRVYEKREGFDALPLQQCPSCNGEARRLLTTPAIVFKGSGWYVNDSRKGQADSEAPAAATTEKGDARDSTKGDARDSKKGDVSDSKPPATEKKSETPAATPTSAAAD